MPMWKAVALTAAAMGVLVLLIAGGRGGQAGGTVVGGWVRLIVLVGGGLALGWVVLRNQFNLG